MTNEPSVEVRVREAERPAITLIPLGSEGGERSSLCRSIYPYSEWSTTKRTLDGLDERVWGAQTRSPSGGRTVLVNQSAESIPPADAIEPARSNDAEVRSGLRRRESESAMRAMCVVVLDVDT